MAGDTLNTRGETKGTGGTLYMATRSIGSKLQGHVMKRKPQTFSRARQVGEMVYQSAIRQDTGISGKTAQLHGPKLSVPRKHQGDYCGSDIQERSLNKFSKLPWYNALKLPCKLPDDLAKFLPHPC